MIDTGGKALRRTKGRENQSDFTKGAQCLLPEEEEEEEMAAAARCFFSLSPINGMRIINASMFFGSDPCDKKKRGLQPGKSPTRGG